MSIVENAQSSMLTRKEAKPYLKRKDWPGLLYLSVHFSLVGGTGYLVSLSTNTTWIVPAILLHGFILSTLFHPLHECIHGTGYQRKIKFNCQAEPLECCRRLDVFAAMFA